jgi:tetratricopeptide (TPR) repeat protein
MNKFLAIVLITCSPGLLFSQDKHILDSLKRELHTDIPDTSRVNTLLNGFATQYYLNDPQRAMKYCEQARELSEKINYIDGISSSYGWLAFLYEQQGEINKAIEFNQKSLQLFRQQKNQKQAATVLNNLAAIYKDRGNIAEALRYNRESLEIKEQIADSEGIATSYNNFGIIYSNQGNVALALDYYYKALKLEEALNNKDGVSTAWHNIGLFYKDQGDPEEAMKAFRHAYELRTSLNDKYGIAYSLNAMGGVYEMYDSLEIALEYYNRAFDLRKKINDKQGMAYSQKNIGGIYEKWNSDEAVNYFTNSLALFTETDDKWGMTIILSKLANYYLKNGQHSRAYDFASKSLLLARELGYPAEIKEAALIMKQLYGERKQWHEAAQMTDLYYVMRDSVQNKENRKDAFKQQYRYEFEKKEAALKAEQDKKNAIAAVELKRQKTEKFIYLGGLSLILLFSGILLNRFRITRKQKEIIEETLQQLKITQKQLIESEKMAAFGILASRMAHEIQNPLNFVNNFAEMSQELLEETATAADNGDQLLARQDLDTCLQKINFHGNRAEKIVRKLQEHINAGTAHEFFLDETN